MKDQPRFSEDLSPMQAGPDRGTDDNSILLAFSQSKSSRRTAPILDNPDWHGQEHLRDHVRSTCRVAWNFDSIPGLPVHAA